MGNGECRQSSEGNWRLLYLPSLWSQELWREISSHLQSIREGFRRHPETRKIGYRSGETRLELYLKIYYPSTPLEGLKDLFRHSRAFRAFRACRVLSLHGFHVPIGVAAGEIRTLRWVRLAFLLTLSVPALPLPQYVKAQYPSDGEGPAVRRKREFLRQLALEVRRMHRLGFIHGDLLASNIMVQANEDQLNFYTLDHDRTRRYPAWLPNGLWRRNLVQLNRVELPGISVRDRIRFLKFYLGCRGLCVTQRLSPARFSPFFSVSHC